jgi:hypothetical protein
MRLRSQGGQRRNVTAPRSGWSRSLYTVFFTIISLFVFLFPCHAEENIYDSTSVEVGATIMAGIDCPYDPACEVLQTVSASAVPPVVHIPITARQDAAAAAQRSSTDIAALDIPVR